MIKNRSKYLVIGSLTLLLGSGLLPRLKTASAAGRGGRGVPLGSALLQTVDVGVATLSGNFQTPLDAAPDPGATTIYFTATGPRGSGVFRVPAGGGAATEVLTGNPFVAPTGIAIGSDGQSIYVADPQAYGGGGRPGQIFVVPVRGGALQALPGTAGTAPRGMDVVNEAGRDILYFTGKDPISEEARVFRIASTGASAPTVVAKGPPLVDPDGVTVTRTGVVYVTDPFGAGGCFGSVFKIDGAAVTRVVDLVRTGNPAGVALSLDESILFVSALQAYSDKDQVLMVHLDTLQTESITKLIGQNRNDAGGLHRARTRNDFAWAGVRAGASGTVFAFHFMM